MKNVFFIPRKAKRNLTEEINKNGFVTLEGSLEIFGTKNGKVYHYDKGDNQVTIWAKHATMHLLTGETFSSHGRQRIFTSEDNTAHTATGVGEGTNKDGTLLSGQQYFSDNTTPNFSLDTRWSKATIDAQTNLDDVSDLDIEMKYPFFPTKMLFGTGFEWSGWTDVPAEYQTSYITEGWDQSTFDTQITALSENIGDNVYSNDFSGPGGTLLPNRSMNDIYSAALTTPVISDTDYGITGAVKDGSYADSVTQRVGGSGTPVLEVLDGNEFLQKQYQGVGHPCFIYSTRESRFFQEGSEIALSYDSNIENKITFQAVMPEQTGSDAGIFYPYNGYTLKEAGLFADARMLLDNTSPEGSGDFQNPEVIAVYRDNYRSMPYGIMVARRYISPIQKSHDVSITSRWTLYL